VSYILFADDEESIRVLVERLLEADGHQVQVESDGERALAAVQQREPDLLILDLSMPRMSGLEVCQQIKSNPFTAHIPILMLTAQSRVDDKVAGFDAGADDYLAKPFANPELAARVRALLRLVRRENDRNPTTGLPGGRAIQEEIDRRAALHERFAICYIDLDHFKPFADTFGFVVADTVIHDTGTIIRAAVEAVGDAHDFVGHIGGDDFIVVTTEGKAEAIAREAAARFPEVAARAIGDDAIRSGSFTGVDREGRVREFRITQLSAVILIVDPERWVSTAHLGAFAAEVKRQAKLQGSGTILVHAS
jgi:PleD family two-component response regulator